MTLRLSALLPLALAAVSAQQQQLPTINVDVDVVSVLCSVQDKRGALIPNLSKDDFEVFEDGKKQEIRYFARETDLPLTIGLLVDVSVSQEGLIEAERRAASQFFSQVLGKKDMAFLISFGAEAELLQDYTNSLKLLRAGLDQLRLSASHSGLHPGPVPTASQPRGTILFDAVYLAADEKLRGEVGRKAIILITDGVDQGSRMKLTQAIEAAHRGDAIVYGIYYYDPGFYRGRSGGFGFGMSDSDLRRMSEETGGRLMKVDRRRPLEEIFSEIQTEMRSQYAIGYTPANSAKDGSFRRLEIRTRNKDLKVRARKGYYAAQARP
ncbi:MAG: VWA domain-containing protein [Acidobacteria bacterium]|nr:VWA domain-containing protein [Acidobacteriota bacterium]